MKIFNTKFEISDEDFKRLETIKETENIKTNSKLFVFLLRKHEQYLTMERAIKKIERIENIQKKASTLSASLSTLKKV